MVVRNAYSLDQEQIYICSDEKTHNFLYNIKKINYINKGLDTNGNPYYIYFYSDHLKDALDELG